MINTSSHCIELNEPDTNRYARIGDFELIKTLNYGTTCKVKLGRHITSKEEYAIKIIKPAFHEKFLSTFEQEGKFMKSLTEEKHDNIIGLVDFLPKADYIKKNGKLKKVFALVLELAEGGNLFECIKALGKLKEEIARTFFIQLVETIEFLNDRGIVHRDIKPDNLLLSADFSLKISDFTFASYILGENDTPDRRQLLIQNNYMAPELLENDNLTTRCLDVFSCGVILFLMVVGVPPFEKASAHDLRYRFILKHQFDQFWKTYERKGREFSDNFKDLINSLICADPAERLSIPEIKAHDWYKGTTCSVDELKEEYKAREVEFLAFKEQKTNELKETKENKSKIKANAKQNVTENPFTKSHHMLIGINPFKHRSLETLVNEQIKERLNSTDIGASRQSKDYVFTGYRGVTEIFYSVNYETIFKLLLLISKQIFNTFKVNSHAFKIKGRIVSENHEQFTGELGIEVNRIDDLACCLNLTRISGSSVLFYKYVDEGLKEIVNKALNNFLEMTSE